MKRIKGLDALRAIAIFLVIITHWGPHGFKTLPVLDFVVKYILPSGDFAVDLFFVLSGFLITSILLQSKQELGNGANIKVLKTFIVRRSLRIFPLYYALLILLFIFNYPNIRDYFAYYSTYTSNYLTFSLKAFNSYSHTWSLAVEEQFYLVWPILILFIPNKYLLKVMLAVIFVSTIAGMVTGYIYGPFARLLTSNCFNAFALGGIYSFALINEEVRAKVKKYLIFLLPFALALYVTQYFDIKTIPLRMGNAIISINLIIYVAERKYGKIEAIIIENSILNSIGKVSYGIYLFHNMIPYYYSQFLIFFHITNNPGNRFFHLFYIPIIAELFQFTFVIALSYFSFYCFEMQVMKLKDRFEYKRVTPAVVTPLHTKM